ncbi:MAG: IS200/IS605 family transposase [Candidatus Marinimicrobia bacterium]|nr:IS200/IS605 family transposase [Candidatus Neomarinimicrobiota bacterium]
MNPGTFTQVIIHLVFAPQMNHSLLLREHRPRIFQCISGIISRLGHKSVIVNGVQDHIHIMLGLKPDLSISHTVKEIKRVFARFINDEKMTLGRFEWQRGFGAFSVSRSQLDRVYQYVADQEEHHKRLTFREEYVQLLKRYDISFNDGYLFEFKPDNTK